MELATRPFWTPRSSPKRLRSLRLTGVFFPLALFLVLLALALMAFVGLFSLPLVAFAGLEPLAFMALGALLIRFHLVTFGFRCALVLTLVFGHWSLKSSLISPTAWSCSRICSKPLLNSSTIPHLKKAR